MTDDRSLTDCLADLPDAIIEFADDPWRIAALAVAIIVLLSVPVP